MAHRPSFDDRDYDMVPSNPVLSSHGADTYPLPVSTVVPAATPVHTLPEYLPEASWQQWKRVDPTMADPVQGDPQMGAQDRLAYRTGFSARSARSYGFTGRMLVAPRQLAHPGVGAVAVDGSRDRLFNGVQAQQVDFTPSAADIARSFLGVRGFRGAQTSVNDSLT